MKYLKKLGIRFVAFVRPSGVAIHTIIVDKSMAKKDIALLTGALCAIRILATEIGDEKPPYLPYPSYRIIYIEVERILYLISIKENKFRNFPISEIKKILTSIFDEVLNTKQGFNELEDKEQLREEINQSKIKTVTAFEKTFHLILKTAKLSGRQSRNRQ